MTKEEIYERGNWVVHINYGLGQVKKLEEKTLGGKSTLYYRVEGENGIFWVPVKKADTHRVRPLVSEKKMRKALRELTRSPEKMENSHKAREKMIKKIRTEGEIIPIAGLVRDMDYRDHQKKLSLSEQDILKDLKKRLVKEWSIVMDIEPDEARFQLEEMLHQKCN